MNYGRRNMMLSKSYETLELSTQLIINEALNRGITVEVLDWDDNFIRLKKNSKIEYIKQIGITNQLIEEEL